MENTGNIYDNFREGDTAKRNEEATPQTKNSQTKISGASKWARRIFTTLAIAGWTLILLLILDTLLLNNKLTIWIMIGK